MPFFFFFFGNFIFAFIARMFSGNRLNSIKHFKGAVCHEDKNINSIKDFKGEVCHGDFDLF